MSYYKFRETCHKNHKLNYELKMINFFVRKMFKVNALKF